MNSEYCNEKLDAGHYWDLKGYSQNAFTFKSDQYSSSPWYNWGDTVRIETMITKDVESILYLFSVNSLNFT